MATMHTIKITDGGNAAPMSRCQIVQTSNDVHGTSFLKAFFKSVCRLKAFDYNERADQVQGKITLALASLFFTLTLPVGASAIHLKVTQPQAKRGQPGKIKPATQHD